MLLKEGGGGEGVREGWVRGRRGEVRRWMAD